MSVGKQCTYCLNTYHKLHGSQLDNNSRMNYFFIGLYGIDTNVIHLVVLFEHRCCVHYLDMNVICMFILFRHECCMSIHIVYIQKLCTWLLCLNNAWHSCVNDTNPWNNIFHTNLEQTHEAQFLLIYSFTWANAYAWCNRADGDRIGSSVIFEDLW
jgi:hypothetical protein